MNQHRFRLGLLARAASRARRATLPALAAAAALMSWQGAASAEPSLQDYRYFRALSIDLQGRIPSRDELTAFEKDGFDLDTWIDERLSGPRYAERVRRVYMDLLRLEISTSFVFQPKVLNLRRATVIGPNGQPLHVYYRMGQRRTRTETDGTFCMTYAETGLQFNSNGASTPATGTKTVTQAILNANTTLVKPWWIYADYSSDTPSDKYDAATWGDLHPGFRPSNALLTDGEGNAVTQIRVCKEEASTKSVGTVYATGLTTPPAAGEPPPYDRLTQLPRDSAFAQKYKGDPIECTSNTALVNSADCGCGKGLERCVPGTATGLDTNAFNLPTEAPLGRELPFVTADTKSSEWSRQAWASEAAAFIDDLVAKDQDFRGILTSKSTMVNGPAAQFHRFFSGAGCCTDTYSFGYNAPITATDPASMPALLPHDMLDFAPVVDRGPHASGILTMPIFLTKYGSRRARAHVLYSAFLCKEFTSTNSELQPSEEPDLTKRSGCKDCHATLEPMAAYFARIRENDWIYLPEESFPVSNPACKPNASGTIPGFCKNYYDPAFVTAEAGELRGAHASPANAEAGPAALAAEIANSEEFPACVAQNMATSFLGRPLTDDDQALREELTKTFTESGFHVRALVRALVLSDAYRLVNDQKNAEEN